MERNAAGSLLWKQGDAAHDVVVLLAGRCRLTVQTPFGRYTVVELPAPRVIGSAELLASSERLASLEAIDDSENVRVGENEAGVLLSAATPAAAAFRRLLISSTTQALRLLNESLGRFFDDIKRAYPSWDPKTSGTFPAAPVTRPADEDRVRELFDRSGLGRPLLSQLGLVERTYPPGARLIRPGEPAAEVFLPYSGRVRISIKIPGAGEEALSIVGPGEIVGEMGLVDDSVRSAYVIAHEGPVTVFVMSRAVFRSLLSGSVNGSALLVARIASSLSRRFQETALRAISFFVLSGGTQSVPAEGALELDERIEDLGSKG